MTKLYIKVVDGVIIDHPMYIDSVKALYPSFDGINLPETIKEFMPVERPKVNPFQESEFSYVFDGDVVKHLWTVRDKTEEEKQNLIDAIGELPDGMYIDLATGFVVNTNVSDTQAACILK